MLKITIDNEEVLSNKNFTIEEEMLNTPSVVLDNVYPKSWENDKDYTSRFYHPNDYSKCLIKDEIYTPAEPGLNVEGTNFQVTADTTKLSELTSMKGQTTQSGTPTPTAPQPINVVSGRQDVVVCGKNLFDKDNAILNKGVSVNTGNLYNDTNCFTTDFIEVETGGVYYTASGYSTSANRVYGAQYDSNKQYVGGISTKAGVKTFYISNANTKYIRLTGLSNEIDTYQVEKGSTATEYEAYKGNTYEINLGKNLFVGIIEQGNYDGTNGNKTGSNAFYRNANKIPVQPNTTYTFSLNGVSQRYVVLFYKSDETFISQNASLTTGTFTTPNNTYYVNFRCFQSDYTDDYATLKVQLEKGSQATSYSSYFTPIELCKIGNYQDRIFKSSGKNLFNDTIRQGVTTYNGGVYSYNAIRLTSTDWITLKAGTYTINAKTNTSKTLQISNITFDTNDNFYNLSGVSGIWKTLPFTFTTPIDIKWKCNFDYSDNSNITINEVNSIMINEGSTALPYEPYGTGWYLEKNIGKVVLDGTRSWQYISVAEGSLFRNANDIINNAIQDDNYAPYSNYYKGIPRAITRANNDIIANVGSNFHYLDIVDNRYTNATDFKNWQATAKPSFYYVLATPTTTEITDSELISQLESIELLEGLNNVSVVSPYLQGIINIHYNFVNEETTSNLLFCGVVKNSGNISLNPRYPHYQSLQILDFKTFLSEGETLDFVIANKTIEEAIDQIISTISPYGFIKGNIQIIGADTIIGAYSTKDKTAYDVFNYLADITQSRWTTRMIDENTVAIDFYDPTLLPQGTPINYNETWFRNNLIDDMSYSYGSNDYRNKQVMTSNEVYGSILQTQTMVANGYQTQFDTELKIGQITSITANGTQLTIATNEQKELGFNADIYYTPGNNYFESADLRSTGEILIVNYIAIVEGRQIITNGTEINRVATATGRKGIVARYENRNDANTSNELQLIGQSYIRYKGTPEIKLTIVSRKNIWNIGDRVQFNAPINELATEYMVKKKTINRILANPSSEEHIVYTYEMTSSFNSEQAINYFDNQRAKAKGNIGESEYITRNVDIENVANIIFYGSNVEQATITGDNTLQATLSSPIIN